MNLSHILFSEDSKKFTYLNSYDRRKHVFEGEHSMIHNQSENGCTFLSRFLYNHKGEILSIIDTSDSRYRDVVNEFDRFMEDDVPKHIEERMQEQQMKIKDLEMDRSLGQLQMNVLKGVLEKELEALRANTVQDPKMLLGRELGLSYALQKLNDMMEKSAFYYK